MTFPLDGYDFIWASPPCQRYTDGAKKWGTSHLHPDLIDPIRRRRVESRTPYIIENVDTARAHLIDPVLLCGTQFDLGVFRHRLFECRSPYDTIPLQVTPWEPCDCCDEFVCNIHQTHAFECPCPAIEEWDGDPYAPVDLRRFPHLPHEGRIGDGKYHTVTGHAGGSSKRDGWKNGGVAEARIAMGIDWMVWTELAEAIPPAYSEFLGRCIAPMLGLI
jgi:DNA (cytosine-5)-methyltransferase 1